ncbi:MAG: enoyl-CoA hydratase/isomerase family protein [Syntrophales bacterium]|jgi:enoyl-CoA hydratase
MKTRNSTKPPIMMRRTSSGMSIILNRKEALNSLNLEMVRLITDYFNEALANDECKLILFYGLGDRGFCAGGDIRRIAADMRNNNLDDANKFFLEEFSLDLMIHRSPKPVIVIADGVTMGGGLGIASGADWVIATEKTRMAMPETRIGFFPDVGATGWMYSKCPPGYPEYLALTSHELKGSECVRVGFATHLTSAAKVKDLIRSIERFKAKGISSAKGLLALLMRKIKIYVDRNIVPRPDIDTWVAEYFAGQQSLQEIIDSLQVCPILLSPCEGLTSELSEMSPTALALTLKLLRHNEYLPMEKVYEADFRAMQFIVRHPDFLEGVRARILDKDDQPRWRPDNINDVDISKLRL